jgi:hypothetical protein
VIFCRENAKTRPDRARYLHLLSREIEMAKRKAAKKTKAAGGRKTKDGVEPMVVKLAEQLGSLLGRVRSKADGLVESAAVRKQVGQIRDGATQLMNRVNQAGAAVKKTVAAKQSKALAPPKRRGREGEKSTTPAAKKRSGGAVDAPGKRHRKSPPQELFDPLLGKPMAQKDVRSRGRRG